MRKNIPVPPSFRLVKKGRMNLLIKEEYRNALLDQGIEDIDIFIRKHAKDSHFLKGREAHPSIPVQGRRIIFRKYSHGGLFRAFSRDLYLFGSRPFQELALTEEIR